MRKNVYMEYSNGQMEENTKDYGIMESNMVREHILHLKVRRKKVNGWKEKRIKWINHTNTNGTSQNGGTNTAIKA